MPIHSLICRPTRSDELSLSSICVSRVVRARSTSSAVGGVVAIASTIFSRPSRAVSSDCPVGPGGEVGQAGIVELEVAAEGLAGLLGLDQRLVEPARGRVAEHQHDEVDGGEIGIGAGRHVVRGHHPLHVADAAHRHAALAVLGRLGGVELGKRARRLRDQRRSTALTSSSVFGSSNLPATTSTALSGW